MYYADKGAETLSLPAIKQLLDDVKGSGTRIEILGGEPLLRADLGDIVRYAKKEARVPQVVVYTNARHADRARAQELHQAGLDIAIVNLVSCDEEEHDNFVGMTGAWKQTINGIAQLMDAGVKVYTFTAVHSVNIHRIKEIYAFVKKQLGAHALFYQYIPQRKDDPLIPDKAQWAEVKHWILREMNPEHSTYFSNFCLLTGSSCSGGNFVFTVKVDGTVTPCPFISDIPLGNITAESIWEIMRGRFAVKEFVEFQSLPPECRVCTYADICNGGCKAGNAVLFGRYAHKDHRCLGPWDEPLRKDAVSDRLPCFF